jgi:RHS repeat-associated protein
MILDYHNQDYIRNATYLQGLKNTTTQNQFNGNISSQRWRNDTPLQPKVDTYNYQYNKNYWLSQANFGSYQLPSGNNFPNHITNNQAIPTNSSRSDKASVSITLQPGFTASLGTKYHAKIIPNGGFNNEGGDYDVTGITYDANGNIQSLKRNKNTENGSNAMDDLNYVYKTDKPNQLLRVEDNEGNAGVGDIDTQTGDNYHYNSIGQLKENLSENLRYAYNASGLVTEVAQLNGTPIVKFYYNDKNHRVKKESYNTQGGNLQNTTYYVRDASGTPLAIYTKQANAPTQLEEHTIYGASRLGVHYRQDNTNAYQLTDHLGNVRAVIVKQGNAAATLTAKTDYYPFGMPMPNRNVEGNYRYKYQGQEKDPETGMEAFELRLWDSRIGRWLTVDPAGQYASPYLGMGNNPIKRVDPDGGTDGDVSCCPGDCCPSGIGAKELTIPAVSTNVKRPNLKPVSTLKKADLVQLEGMIPTTDFGLLDNIQSSAGYGATLFSGIADYGSWAHNMRVDRLLNANFDFMKINGYGAYVSDNSFIWRTNNVANIIPKNTLNYINRYSTGLGRFGAKLQTIDVGISFYKGAVSENSNDQIYYTTEGFLKSPGYIPYFGTAWSLGFEPVIRPIWHNGAETYRDAIHRGADPSIVFIIPGLGYAPPVKYD